MDAKTDPLKTLLILEDQSIVGKRAWQVATATRLSQLAMEHSEAYNSSVTPRMLLQEKNLHLDICC